MILWSWYQWAKKYEGFQHELFNQLFDDMINLESLVYSLPRYSKDKNWEKNVLRIIKQLEVRWKPKL